MKFLSFFLALCFSLNVIAASGSITEFEKALDNFHYSLTVEWDQKDEAFLTMKTNEFNAYMKEAIASGLTHEEILTLLESKIENTEAFEAIKLKVSLLSKNLSQEELIKEISESSNLYARGSSWNADRVISIAGTIFLIWGLTQVAKLIYFDLTHECVKTENKYDCWSSCHGPSDFRFCDQSCGYRDVCVEYAKKK